MSFHSNHQVVYFHSFSFAMQKVMLLELIANATNGGAAVATGDRIPFCRVNKPKNERSN